MICKKKSWDISTIVENHERIRLSCPVYVVTPTTYRSQTQRSHTHWRDCNTAWSRLLFCIFAQIFLSKIIKYIIIWSWPLQSSWLDHSARRKWYHLSSSHYSRITQRAIDTEFEIRLVIVISRLSDVSRSWIERICQRPLVSWRYSLLHSCTFQISARSHLKVSRPRDFIRWFYIREDLFLSSC